MTRLVASIKAMLAARAARPRQGEAIASIALRARLFRLAQTSKEHKADTPFYGVLVPQRRPRE